MLKPFESSDLIIVFLIHALYADDFLHFTYCSILHQFVQKQFPQIFGVKTGSVGVFLGNRINTDPTKLTVEVNQSQFVNNLLARFDITDCKTVSNSLVARLAKQSSSSFLSDIDHIIYRNMVGSMLYLAC